MFAPKQRRSVDDFGAFVCADRRKSVGSAEAGSRNRTGDDSATGGDIMNAIRKYVPTSTFSEPTWNASFISGDVVAEVVSLKRGSENLVVYGSGRLSESLRAKGLVDEYRLLICPIVLGEGRKLFTDASPSKFRVKASNTAPSGMVLLTLTTD